MSSEWFPWKRDWLPLPLACRIEALRTVAHGNAATAKKCYDKLRERRQKAIAVTTELHELPPNRRTIYKTHAKAYVFRDTWPGGTYHNSTWTCHFKESASIQECEAANNLYEGIVKNITRQFEQECHWSSAKSLIQQWKDFWIKGRNLFKYSKLTLYCTWGRAMFSILRVRSRGQVISLIAGGIWPRKSIQWHVCRVR